MLWTIYNKQRNSTKLTLHKKRSFPLRVSSENVTKSVADLVKFTEEILNGKLLFCAVLNKQEIHDIFIKTNKIKLVFKYLTWRTDSNEILRDKAFNITKNSKYDGYQRGTASMV